MSPFLLLARDAPLFPSFATVSPATGRSFSVPTVSHLNQHPSPSPQAQHQPEISLLDDYSDMQAAYATKRNDSMFSSPSNEHLRHSPLATTTRTATTVRTRSLGYGAGVVFERSFAEPTGDDLIIITVRLTNKFRKSSLTGAEELPSRPPPRSFLRRVSTRLNIDHSAEKEERYKAIKLPRREYKRHFARDGTGAYAGTEPEREWEESELMREYGRYQDLPLVRFASQF